MLILSKYNSLPSSGELYLIMLPNTAFYTECLTCEAILPVNPVDFTFCRNTQSRKNTGKRQHSSYILLNFHGFFRRHLTNRTPLYSYLTIRGSLSMVKGERWNSQAAPSIQRNYCGIYST